MQIDLSILNIFPARDAAAAAAAAAATGTTNRANVLPLRYSSMHGATVVTFLN